MSSSRRSLDPALIAAVTCEVQARLPAGEPLTLDALEAAVLGVLHELGPAVAEHVVAPGSGPQKKGLRRSVAGRQCGGSDGVPADS